MVQPTMEKNWKTLNCQKGNEKPQSSTTSCWAGWCKNHKVKLYGLYYAEVKLDDHNDPFWSSNQWNQVIRGEQHTLTLESDCKNEWWYSPPSSTHSYENEMPLTLDWTNLQNTFIRLLCSMLLSAVKQSMMAFKWSSLVFTINILSKMNEKGQFTAIRIIVSGCL